MMALLVGLGALLGVLVNETVAEPRVPYLSWSRAEQLASRREAVAPVDLGDATGEKLTVHVFFSSQCPDCKIFKEKLYPILKKNYGEYATFKEYDTDETDNVKKLFEFKEKYGLTGVKETKEDSLRLFFGKQAIVGVEQAFAKAESALQEELLRHMVEQEAGAHATP